MDAARLRSVQLALSAVNLAAGGRGHRELLIQHSCPMTWMIPKNENTYADGRFDSNPTTRDRELVSLDLPDLVSCRLKRSISNLRNVFVP